MVAPCVLVGFSLFLSMDVVPITGVSRIDIPHRDGFYGKFNSVVLESQEEFDKLVGRDKRNGLDAFAEAIEEAKVDFTKESLVLVRHTKGSGSVQVRFRLSEAQDGTLEVKIFEHTPSPFMTADMAYYCYAFKVERGEKRRVKVRHHAEQHVDNVLGLMPTLDISPKK